MSHPELKLPSGKELVVLELLVAKHEMYGLEMVKASDRLVRGTIYVLLNRMEDKGFVTSCHVKEAGASGNPKRVYKVTGLGQRALEAWRQAQAVYAGALAVAGGS